MVIIRDLVRFVREQPTPATRRASFLLLLLLVWGFGSSVGTLLLVLAVLIGGWTPCR